MLASQASQPASSRPEGFVVEVFSELDQQTVQGRWHHLNVILRMSMLTGMHMQLDATLNLMCDMAGEITCFDRALIYFWNEGTEQAELRIARGFDRPIRELEGQPNGNVFHFWAVKYSRPLLIARGEHVQADELLDSTESNAALVIPLFVRNRAIGSLQLFCRAKDVLSPQDAQLLWILSLVGENLLTREHANEGLLRFAFTDYLTGLRTRGYFEQQLELEFKRAERKQQKFSLLMIDIDHFKQLNDTFGHHVGDQVLREIAAILMRDLREVDTVARYGGEEFVMILPETTEAGAVYVAQRIRKSVEQAKFLADCPTAVQHLTISIGIAVFDRDARFKRDLIEFADAALYAAKHGGRNRVMCYSEVAGQQKVS